MQNISIGTTCCVMLFYSFSAQWKHFKKWKMGSVVIHLKYGVQKLKFSLNFCPLKKCSCPACWLHKNITQSVFSKDQMSFSLYSQSQSYHEKWNEWKILSFTMICKNWRIKKKKVIAMKPMWIQKAAHSIILNHCCQYLNATFPVVELQDERYRFLTGPPELIDISGYRPHWNTPSG